MKEEKFKDLMDKKKFQFFVLSSRLPFPFSFAVHTWIITNKKGKCNRYEVWEFKDMKKDSIGHVNKNLMEITLGIKKFFFFNEYKFESKVIGNVSGNIAKKMINFVEKNYSKYKYSKDYLYIPGPNSNTFTQWVIGSFPNAKLKLPWNAFGKNYKF